MAGSNGLTLTEKQCAARYVEFGQPAQRMQVGEMTGEQIELFLEETLWKLHPGNQKEVTAKFRYLTSVDLWDDLAKWWALDELGRLTGAKKSIVLFVA